MELTESAFNVLLDMTSTQTPSQTLGHTHRDEMKDSKTHNSRPMKQAAGVMIYYHDGAQTIKIAHSEILDRVCAAPKGTHLLWCPGNDKWRSWQELPKLREAVYAKLATTSLSSGLIPPASEEHHGETMTHASDMEKLHAMRAPQMDRGDTKYLSVPETAFTRFNLELRDHLRVIPFVGLDGLLENGGLFIATTRVLNVGDYIQITLTHKERVVLHFEAPIAWLRWPDDRSNFPEGVGVFWPKMTAREYHLIRQLTHPESYEFYVA